MKRTLRASVKALAAGHPVRVRFDPIVPGERWCEEHASSIRRIFEVLTPKGPHGDHRVVQVRRAGSTGVLDDRAVFEAVILRREPIAPKC